MRSPPQSAAGPANEAAGPVRVAIATALMVAGLLASGCAAAKPDKTPASADPGRNLQINAWLAKQLLDLPGDVYRVQPPDVIKVSSPGIKELDGQTSEIRADGDVVFNLVGEIPVAGKTPAEISVALSDALAKYYQKNTFAVSVNVTEFKSKVIYVFGQVIDPGIKPYTGRNTVLGTLADAKLNTLAWPQKVLVVRPSENPKTQQRVTVDLKTMYETGKSEQNFLLEEGDVIYVPPSPLAQVDVTFQKLVFPLIPVGNLALTFGGL